MRNRLTFFLILFISLPVYSAQISLSGSETTFLSGANISVSFSNTGKLKPKSWVGIFKSGVTSRDYLTYKYLGENASGTLTFSAPKDAGDYEFRLLGPGYDKEYDRISFSVKKIGQEAVQILLDKTVFKPVEEMKVKLIVDGEVAQKSWVGIFPAKVAHHQINGYLSYQYTQGNKQNTFIFATPEKPGAYDLRFFDDSYGNEITSLPFTVSEFSLTGLSLKTDKKSYSPQANMQVNFIASKEFPAKAWIGLFKGKLDKATNNGDNYLDYRYINKQEKGVLAFKTPTVKGDYHLKMFSSNNGSVVAKTDFSVSHSLDSNFLKKEIDAKGKISLYGIYFDIDKSNIKPASKPVLVAVANLLKSQPDLLIQIQGHTDNIGDESYNLSLSNKRAQAVKRYLVEQLSVPSQRLQALGFGETQPVASNDHSAQRALNRRVDIVKVSAIQ